MRRDRKSRGLSSCEWDFVHAQRQGVTSKPCCRRPECSAPSAKRRCPTYHSNLCYTPPMAANPLPPCTDIPRRSHLYPVRGQVLSVWYTCPGCAIAIKVQQLDRRQGVNVCHRCTTVVRIGISCQILPSGPFAGQILPSDYSFSARAHALLASRLRSRRRRAKALHELGLADPMPLAVEMPWAPGAPINSVEVIADPRKQSETDVHSE